ncbi:MAG: hypothetical protein ABR568_24225 [Pyrinomonadaceae bacterium]
MVLTNTSSDDIKLAEIGFNANMTISGTPAITYAAGTVCVGYLVLTTRV